MTTVVGAGAALTVAAALAVAIDDGGATTADGGVAGGWSACTFVEGPRNAKNAAPAQTRASPTAANRTVRLFVFTAMSDSAGVSVRICATSSPAIVFACASAASSEGVSFAAGDPLLPPVVAADRKSTRLNSSHEWISYAVFCL